MPVQVPNYLFKVIVFECDNGYQYLTSYMIPNKDIRYGNINDFYVDYKKIEEYLGLEVFNKLDKKNAEIVYL